MTALVQLIRTPLFALVQLTVAEIHPNWHRVQSSCSWIKTTVPLIPAVTFAHILKDTVESIIKSQLAQQIHALIVASAPKSAQVSRALAQVDSRAITVKSLLVRLIHVISMMSLPSTGIHSFAPVHEATLEQLVKKILHFGSMFQFGQLQWARPKLLLQLST